MLICLILLQPVAVNPQQDTDDISEQLAGLLELGASLGRCRAATIRWSTVQEVV